MTNKQAPFSADARKIAESTVEQTRKAYETVAEASEKAMAPIQSALPPAAQEFNKKIFSYTHNNINEMFDLAQKIVQATSLEEVTKLQSQYLADQSRAFQEQAQELTSSFKSAVSPNTVKAPKGKASSLEE
jgi:hypothetical protein